MNLKFEMASGLCLTQYLSQARICKALLTNTEGHDVPRFKHKYMHIPLKKIV